MMLFHEKQNVLCGVLDLNLSGQMGDWPGPGKESTSRTCPKAFWSLKKLTDVPGPTSYWRSGPLGVAKDLHVEVLRA